MDLEQEALDQISDTTEAVEDIKKTKKPMSNFRRKLRKFMRWSLFIIVLLVAGFVFFKYFYTYSDGYRYGRLQKFSHKGYVFKTYEGEMILLNISSTSESNMMASEKFLFSVEDQAIANELNHLQGQEISVYYKEKKSPIFFRGDSPYIVDSVSVRTPVDDIFEDIVE